MSAIHGEIQVSTASKDEEEDANDEYSDSSYEDDNTADTARTISDSIHKYREIHGRTFHNNQTSDYWAPNDETQNEHHDIGHNMWLLLLDDELFLAPIGPDPKKVLDVGTGTGLWAIDFAESYPSAEVIGTDLSPSQPDFHPDNVKFEFEDAELQWIYPDNEFDFVHLRYLVGSFKDWPSMFEQAFRCTKPGGWIESFDIDIQPVFDDGSVQPENVLYEFSQMGIKTGEIMGRSFEVKNHKTMMEQAGFVDVVEKKFKLPLGSWMEDPKHKELGKWCLMFMDQGVEGMILYMATTILGWEMPKVQEYVANMRKALKSKKNRCYYWIHVIYGRKPEV